MIKRWLKEITGVAAIEAAARDAESRRIAEESQIESLLSIKDSVYDEIDNAKQQLADAELAKLDAKARATVLEEPYIAVLETKVNPDNIRNGFFELDWNEFFIAELISNGYGTIADPEEEIVDRWFRDIVHNMFAEEGLDTSRGSGYINVVPLGKGKSQVS